MTLNKTELTHPIFYMLFTGISTFSAYELIGKSYSEIINAIPWLILFYIIYQILNLSKRVELKKNEIIEGIYINPIGFVKVNNRILIKDVIEIGMQQNSKKYFELFTKSKYDTIIIKVIANKFPAERELQIVKNEIQKCRN